MWGKWHLRKLSKKLHDNVIVNSKTPIECGLRRRRFAETNRYIYEHKRERERERGRMKHRAYGALQRRNLKAKDRKEEGPPEEE